MTLPKFSTSRCWPKLPPTSQLWQTVSILIQLSSINWSSPKSPKRTVSWNDLLSPNCSYPVQWQLSQTAFHFLKSSCSFKCIQLGVNTNSTWVDDPSNLILKGLKVTLKPEKKWLQRFYILIFLFIPLLYLCHQKTEGLKFIKKSFWAFLSQALTLFKSKQLSSFEQETL